MLLHHRGQRLTIFRMLGAPSSDSLNSFPTPLWAFLQVVQPEQISKPTALTLTPAIQARHFLLDVLEDLDPNEQWQRRRS
jgi:hypothetical protein